MSTAARTTTNSATASGSYETYLAALANSVTNSSNLTNFHLLPHKVTWKRVVGSIPARVKRPEGEGMRHRETRTQHASALAPTRSEYVETCRDASAMLPAFKRAYS